MTTVYVEVDGRPQPIRDCSWVQLAPCGCTCAVLSAGGEHNMPTLADEDQMLDFYEIPKWQRKEDANNGFHYELIDRHQACEQIKESCAHIPKWGVEPRPELDGMQWATKYGRNRRWHLVPCEAVSHPGQLLREVTRDAPALCGSTEPYWHEDEFADLPDCKKCTKVARERMTIPLEMAS